MEVFGPEAARPEPAEPSLLSTSPQDPAPDTDTGDSGRPVIPASPAGPGEGFGDVNFQKLPRDLVLLDRFRVIRQIGKGGFGAIYLVDDSAVREELILKILNPQFSADETAILRFVQELKVTRSITHQNVIRIYDFLDLGQAHAVSMEYFPGKDLGKVILREKSLDPRRTLGIVSQICHGLQAAHDKGVNHRDIKPANLLVGENDMVKIVDFGLASVAQQVGSRLTKSGLLIGTPEYMAPEQISGGETDHRADIYSLGLVIYELLSGKKPFTADTPVKILFQHLEGEAQPLSELVENMPANLEDLVARTMAKSPDDRPQGAMELLAEIEGILAGLADAA
jgi:serine/threonine-protein kinase